MEGGGREGRREVGCKKFDIIYCILNRIDFITSLFTTVRRKTREYAGKKLVQKKNEPCQQENCSLFVFPLVPFVHAHDL